MKMWKMIGMVVGAIVAIPVAIFGMTALGYMGASFFNPWGEQIRRDTHIQSQAYNEGQVQNLRKLRVEYYQADNDAERTAITLSARQMVGQMDRDNIPSDLRSWIDTL